MERLLIDQHLARYVFTTIYGQVIFLQTQHFEIGRVFVTQPSTDEEYQLDELWG